MRTAALALALVLLPGTAFAKGLTPDAAEAKRAALEVERSSNPRVAIEQLDKWADEFGDPELFLTAATIAYDEAKSSRDLELALLSANFAATAADIGLYLADGRNYGATDWRPVTQERAGSLAAEAQAMVLRATTLAQEIESERAAAAADAERARNATAEEPRKQIPPGTGLIMGGSVAVVIGAVGVGMLAGGLVTGKAHQREADALMPGDFAGLAEIDRKGAKSNAIAAAGGVMAGVGIIVGVTLLAVGFKRYNAAPDASASRPTLLVDGWFDRGGGGLVLRGRF